jgi:hypothetical protein
MTCEAVLRAASTPDVVTLGPGPRGAKEPGAPEGDVQQNRGSWWHRIRRAVLSPRGADEYRVARLRELLVVLDAARAELLKGWVQGGWWSVPVSAGSAPVTGPAAVGGMPDQVAGVCLVGALVRAARPGRHGGPADGADVGRAVDAVYNSFWEAHGQGSGSRIGGLDPLSSPPVRLARVQWLTRWNDEAGRTRDEVVEVIDRAIARTTHSLDGLTERTPAPSLP